jgi:hypothetical protein
MHVSYPYALLSDLAYAIDFADLTAKTPTTLSGGTPFNYTAKALYQNSAFTSNNTALTGFAAKSSDFAVTVFQNGSQYVIAFRGSDSTAVIRESALPFRGVGRGKLQRSGARRDRIRARVHGQGQWQRCPHRTFARRCPGGHCGKLL